MKQLRGIGIRTLVGYAILIGILLGAELYFNKWHISFPTALLSVADLVDMTVPYVMIPFYWEMYTFDLSHRGIPNSPKPALVFILVTVIWCQGHALHLSANSIANLLEASGLHIRSEIVPDSLYRLPLIEKLGGECTVAHVVDFIDERLSHMLWTLGMILLQVLGVWHHASLPGNSAALQRTNDGYRTLSIGEMLVLFLAALSYVAAFWGSCIEGQTSFLGFPFALLMFFVLASRLSLVLRTPLLFFYFSAAISILAAFSLYTWYFFPFFLRESRIPEFSEVTSLYS